MVHLPLCVLALCVSQSVFLAPSQPANAGPGDGLDKAQIQAVVLANISDVKRCYQVELAHAPTLAGRGVYEFKIRASGEVESVEVVKSELPGSLDTCLANALRTWAFPARSGGNVVVTYPFNFSPS